MKRGTFATTTLLDRICGIDLPACTSTIDAFSGTLRLDSVCGADYRARNPVVDNVFTSLVSFRPLYTAGCLKASNGDYCFADALANTAAPEDLFIYSLPLGTNLPTSDAPTTSCSECKARTMAVFAAAAGNETQPLSRTFEAAAEQLNAGTYSLLLYPWLSACEG